MITKQKIEKVVTGVIGDLLGTILKETLIESLEDLFFENQKQIFRINEAAKYLGVFDLTLRNWMKANKIKGFRTVGGHRRFKKEELDKIIDAEGKDISTKARKCRECGCTNAKACHTSTGPCFWVEKDLCNLCHVKLNRN